MAAYRMGREEQVPALPSRMLKRNRSRAVGKVRFVPVKFEAGSHTKIPLEDGGHYHHPKVGERAFELLRLPLEQRHEPLGIQAHFPCPLVELPQASGNVQSLGTRKPDRAGQMAFRHVIAGRFHVRQGGQPSPFHLGPASPRSFQAVSCRAVLTTRPTPQITLSPLPCASEECVKILCADWSVENLVSGAGGRAAHQIFDRPMDGRARSELTRLSSPDCLQPS